MSNDNQRHIGREIKIVQGTEGAAEWGTGGGSGYVTDADGNAVGGYVAEITRANAEVPEVDERE